MKEGKNPLVSKTLLFNALVLIVTVAGYYGFKEFEPAQEVQPLAEGLYALVTILIPFLAPVVNMVLRFVTREPIILRR